MNMLNIYKQILQVKSYKLKIHSKRDSNLWMGGWKPLVYIKNN